MKASTTILALFIVSLTLAACNTTKGNNPADVDVGPTGYWYLGDNGERQWRTLNPGDIPPPAPVVRKNYARDMGNGSGRS